MYAIIANGGKQYKVQEGDLVRVEKIDVAEGARLDLDYDGTVQVGGLSLAGRGQVGVVDATTCPGFLTGRGKLDVRPNGTIMIFR